MANFIVDLEDVVHPPKASGFYLSYWQKEIKTINKIPRGFAWQIITYNLEKLSQTTKTLLYLLWRIIIFNRA